MNYVVAAVSPPPKGWSWEAGQDGSAMAAAGTRDERTKTMQSKLNDRILWGIALAVFLLGSFPQMANARPADDSVIRLGGTSVWLGVVLRDVSTADVQAQKLPGDYGAVIVGVEDNSPAAKAGLKSGDVLVEFAGREIWSVSELERWVGDTPAGRTVQVKFFRDGVLKLVNVTLESHSREFRMPAINIPPIKVPDFSHFRFLMPHPRLGVTGQTLTTQLAHYFGVDQGKGVLVTEVQSGSAAEKAGLKAGDCIVQFGSKTVDGLEDLQSAVSSASAGQEVTMTIVRNHQRKELKASLPDSRSEMSWPVAVISKT
ncbi:MAG: PDZ domain-containing protein [Terriglobia bacterium]